MHNRGVMHRDIKSDNIMLAVGPEGFRIAKIADLGTAVRFESSKSLPSVLLSMQSHTDLSKTHTLGAGTPLWMAPEVLKGRHGKAKYGPKADVYSYGIVLWEIHARTIPYTDVITKNHFELTQKIADGLRPVFPPNISEPVAWYKALMENCWAGDPNDRPTFSTILEIFSSNANSKADTSAYASPAAYVKVLDTKSNEYEKPVDLTAAVQV